MSVDQPNITKDLRISDVIEAFPATVEVFEKHGLHCSGCHVALWDSIEKGAALHDVDLSALLADLNAFAQEP